MGRANLPADRIKFACQIYGNFANGQCKFTPHPRTNETPPHAPAFLGISTLQRKHEILFGIRGTGRGTPVPVFPRFIGGPSVQKLGGNFSSPGGVASTYVATRSLSFFFEAKCFLQDISRSPLPILNVRVESYLKLDHLQCHI
jgi:hypothetical protein